MPVATITKICPAKINLALSVGPPAPPKGYHPIASWMSAISLADHLTVSALPAGSTSQYDLAFASDCPKPLTVDWPLEKDLCVRAHRLLEARAQRPLPLSLHLRKTVPSGGGLGGGSSDAAFTLIAIKELYNLPLTETDLIALALQLGSDVPFFIGVALGRSAALVTGLGEQLAPLPLLAPLQLVLIFPPFGTPTGPVYHAFDAALPSHPQPPQVERIVALSRLEPLPQTALFNDLAAPACQVVPELASIQRQLANLLHMPVHITGSGSTLFILAPSSAAATALAQTIRSATSLAALPACTLP